MPKRIRVRIDTDKLLDHMSKEQGRQLAIAEVLTWLADAGFDRIDETHWIVHEKDLGQLDPAEVLEAEIIDIDTAP